MSTNLISMEMKQLPRINKLVSTIKGKTIQQCEVIDFNPKWMLAITSDSSRYWIHPDSGKVLVIVEK